MSMLHTNGDRPKPRTLYILLLSIALGLLLQIGFNRICTAIDAPKGYTSFLPTSDEYADYLKVVLSYPGRENVLIGNAFGLERLTYCYLTFNPYRGVEGLGTSQLTHLHHPPLTTCIALLNVKIMAFIQPAVLGLLLGSLSILPLLLLGKISGATDSHVLWSLLCLLCYPVLFVIQRGNLFAVWTSLGVIFFGLSVLQRRHMNWGMLALAVAINIKPNAVVFASLLLILPWREGLGYLVRAGYLTVAILLASLTISHLWYPNYTMGTFTEGLRNYYNMYVLNGGGIAYGSSFLGAVDLLLNHYTGWAEALGAILCLGLCAAALLLFRQSRSTTSVLSLSLCSGYALGSSVFGDYHILVFFLPLCTALRNLPQSPSQIWSHRAVLLTCVLLLIPKHYLFLGEVSMQAVFNPIILLLGSLWALTQAWRESASITAPSTPACPQIHSAM